MYLCTQGIQASMARAHCSLFSQPRSRLWLQRLVTSASKCQTSSVLRHQLMIQLSRKLSSQSDCQLRNQLWLTSQLDSHLSLKSWFRREVSRKLNSYLKVRFRAKLRS